MDDYRKPLSEIISKINIKPDQLAHLHVHRLIHDLRASTQAFQLTIEELELRTKTSNHIPENTHEKFGQLKKHLLCNQIAVEQLCHALANAGRLT